MTERYTDKDCREYAKLLAEALGKKFGNCWEKDPTTKRPKAVIGCWDVDYNPVYNGCVITEKTNEGGGERHPLLANRLPPREFCDAVTMARRAVELSRSSAEAAEELPLRGGMTRKILIGHGKDRDVYEEMPSGRLWEYTGTKLEHWSNSKYWHKVDGKKQRGLAK